MSKRKEKISAFLDNDMHRDELMSFSLSAEPDDAKVAQRYQIMGETIRGELSDTSFVDVSSAVSEALAGENIAEQCLDLQSPVQQVPDTNKKSGVSASSTWGLSAWFSPAVGMAFAVMVAVVMVLTISEQESGSFTPVAVNIDKNPAVQSTAVAVDGSVEHAVPLNANNIATNQKAKDIDPHVDQHLVNQHLEFATQDALQGRLPYVRAVSYESKK